MVYCCCNLIFGGILIYFTCLFILGDSTCGQRALYQFGLTGIPVYNVGASRLKVVSILLF